MRKFLKNQKGFTLIELMMVIAVIGILAAVLIPKISGVKDNAKLSGVDSNVRQIQAVVNGVIERHQNNADATKFATAIVNGLTGMVNPFNSTEVDGAVATADATFVAGKEVTVAKKTGDSAPTEDVTLAGQIYVTYTIETTGTKGVSSVVITPYDDKGKFIATTTVTP